LGKKLENRLLHRVIMWSFVCGSEFRARWHDWILDSCRAAFYQNASKKKERKGIQMGE
jgi:hypothetical protein